MVLKEGVTRPNMLEGGRTAARNIVKAPPAAIDCCLAVADDQDVQVMIHTDALNESGFVEIAVAAFKGRTIHAYHTERAGGGHAPDFIKVCGTNPTRP